MPKIDDLKTVTDLLVENGVDPLRASFIASGFMDSKQAQAITTLLGLDDNSAIDLSGVATLFALGAIPPQPKNIDKLASDTLDICAGQYKLCRRRGLVIFGRTFFRNWRIFDESDDKFRVRIKTTLDSRCFNPVFSANTTFVIPPGEHTHKVDLTNNKYPPERFKSKDPPDRW
jgi:hypothetical protein